MNNPSRYIDPTGHISCSGSNWSDGPQCKDDGDSNWATNIERERQDWLFSRAFKGSARDGSWTAEDWRTYHSNPGFYFQHPDRWINPDPAGLAGWKAHVTRLASYYGSGDREGFMRDFALLFGGVPYYRSPVNAATSVAGGPHELSFVNESPDGLAPEYWDKGENQSHHYAGLFFAGYYWSPAGGTVIDIARDGNKWKGFDLGDMNLGSTAAEDGWNYRISMSPSDVPGLIDALSVYSSPIIWTHTLPHPMP